eukprot:4967895-Amphidinium_carterae.1
MESGHQCESGLGGVDVCELHAMRGRFDVGLVGIDLRVLLTNATGALHLRPYFGSSRASEQHLVCNHSWGVPRTHVHDESWRVHGKHIGALGRSPHGDCSTSKECNELVKAAVPPHLKQLRTVLNMSTSDGWLRSLNEEGEQETRHNLPSDMGQQLFVALMSQGHLTTTVQ